ncbi:MAG: DEAD/DEAH box helicase, partial [Veillonella sp.]|nr:DEAD/DEAH box helicase [Veillonella sp.]
MNEALTSIKGVGPGIERQLHKLGITSVNNLRTYFPRSYEDRRKIYTVRDLLADMTGGVVGIVMAVQEKRPRPRLSILEITITDNSGSLKIVLFNQGYKKNFYKVGQRLYVYGKVDVQYGSKQMNTPQMESLSPGMEPDQGIIPIYPLVEGVSQFVVRSAVKQWFAANQSLPDLLPDDLGSEHTSMSRYQAFKNMHFPTSSEAFEKARHQLAYEELFIMQSGLALLRNKEQEHVGSPMRAQGTLVEQYVKSLPFSLTNDQRKAFGEIARDMEEEHPMQRLVQGDVGSGKTVVATMSLLKAVENGFQGVLMAPTEILAQQHAEGIEPACRQLGVTVALLTGSSTKKEKEA